MNLQDFISLSQPERQAEFVRWIGTKPADERYSFSDVRMCALGQFAQTLVNPAEYGFIGGGSVELCFAAPSDVATVVVLSRGILSEFNTFGQVYQALSTHVNEIEVTV